MEPLAAFSMSSFLHLRYDMVSALHDRVGEYVTVLSGHPCKFVLNMSDLRVHRSRALVGYTSRG